MNLGRSILAIAVTVAGGAAICVTTQCGGLASNGDGADGAADVSDGSAALCTTGAFGVAVPIAELNTPADERGLRFTPDELLGVFSRAPKTDASAWKPLDLYRTTRPSRSAGLASPDRIMFLLYDKMEVPAVYPTVTADALSLFYESYCFPANGPANSPLCLAQRDSGADEFNGLTPMLVDIANQHWPGPFGGGQALGDGFVTRDAGAYYFVSQISPDGGLYAYFGDPDAAGPSGQGVFVTYPKYPAQPPPNAFGTEPFRVATHATSIIDNPVLTEDELTMFVSTTMTNDPNPHIQVMTRASTGEAFGPLTPLHELDSSEGEYPSWVSPDRCRLYLTRTIGGQSDLFVASRLP